MKSFNSNTFDELLNNEIEALYKPLVHFISRLANPGIAQDILHDAIIILILKNNKHGLRNPQAIKPFLYTTVKWLVKGHQRYHAKFVNCDNMEYISNIIDESLSPLSSLEQAQFNKDVLQFISQLKQKRDKELLVQHFWHDTPHLFRDAYQVSSEQYSRLLYRAKHRLHETICKRTHEHFSPFFQND